MSTPMGGDTTDTTNFCYRHPDRQSFILCQRCGRTICPECQTEAAVGFHCPECLRESRASAPASRPALLRTMRRARTSDGPVVTFTLIGVTALVYVLQLAIPAVTNALAYFPVLTTVRPWTMLTSVFLHSPSSFLHIIFNMLSLFIFGRILEQALGRWRFLALYLISGFGGSVAVLLLNPTGGAVGASGAIFGLLGAFFILQQRLGGNSTQLIVLIALNLAIGFIVPGISWQAHVGGLVAGGAVAFAFAQTRAIRQRPRQILYVSAIVAALVALTVLGVGRIFA